ncbi:hypothetical protein [Streptomyces vinaceus]|uniref:hypothetical protein n=1 Tax=Streptomyces vinaceus TaxID=1960 RepID=UPI0036C5DB6C
MAWEKYRRCTDADKKAFLAVPGIVDYVTKGLKFTGAVDIIPEAVRCDSSNKNQLQYLVMGGQPSIDADEDNREGYAFITNGAIADPFKAIVLPVLD